MDSLLPYAVASTAAFIAGVVLLYEYLRRRIEDWLALAAVLLLLFMGAAYEDLLTPFQIGYFGSMAFGLGALLALERRDDASDAGACLLLVASLSFSSLGIPFAIGAAVAIALTAARRGAPTSSPSRCCSTRSGTPAGATRLATSSASGTSRQAPHSCWMASRASVCSLLGLTTPSSSAATAGSSGGARCWWRWFSRAAASAGDGPRPALALGGGGDPALVLVPDGEQHGLWPGPQRIPLPVRGRRPAAAGDCGAAQGWRPGRPAMAAILAVCAVAAISNVSALRDAYNVLRLSTGLVRGALAGLEIAADRVDPGFVLTAENSGFDFFRAIKAGPYLSAAEEFGSPAYAKGELPAAPEPARVAADKVLAAALPVSFEPGAAAGPTGPPPVVVAPPGAGTASSASCVTVRPARGGPAIVSLPAGGGILSAAPGVSAELGLRRFARDSFPVPIGKLTGRALLVIPPDRSRAPWELALDASRPGRRSAAASWDSFSDEAAKPGLPLADADVLVRGAGPQRAGGPPRALPPPGGGRPPAPGGLRVHPRGRREQRPQPRPDERAAQPG